MPTQSLRSIEDLPLYETGDPAQSPDEKFSHEDVNFARDPAGYHVQAYRKYGPIYRTRFRNQIWVAIGGLDANDFAWRNPDAWSYQKAMVGFGEELGYEHVTTMDGPPHRMKRRSLKPAFKMDAVLRHLSTMSEVAAEQFAQHSKREIDLYEFCMQTLIRMSARTMLQTEVDDKMVAEMAEFEEKFMRGLNLGEFRHEYFAKASYLKTKKTVFDFLGKIIKEREERDDIDDNLAAVIRERPEEAGEYSFEEKLYDSYLILIAGAENTTKLITWVMQYLDTMPEWRQALREELEGWEPLAFMDGLRDFPKLKATLMEGERMQPGAIFHLRVAAQDIELFGYRIPKDTPVLHIQALCHFLDEIYEDPLEFRPERWLDREYPKKAHGTFGGGTHICLGMNVTRIHSPVLLANLYKNYDLKLGFKPDYKHVLDLGGAFHRVPLPAEFVPIG